MSAALTRVFRSLWMRETKSGFWFVRVDDEGYPENSPLHGAGICNHFCRISAGGMYCPECGMVHWSDGVTPPF
ncbi:hypothetical protein ACLB1N_00810 [Escherichia coli]